MADTKHPALVPTAECEEGQVRIELPNGKWLLSATCQTDEQTEGGRAKPQPELDEEEQNSAVSNSRGMGTYGDTRSYSKKLGKMAGIASTKTKIGANDNIDPYHMKLREVMCLALSKTDLKLVCADLELGAEFVGNGTLELEYQRVIDECKRSGRHKMEFLLSLLCSRRPDRAFPNLPPDGDSWWTDGSRASIYRHPAQKRRG